MLPTCTLWLHSYLMLPKACRLPERLLAGLPAPLQQQLSQTGGTAPQQQPQRVAFSREAMLTTHAFRGRAPAHAATAAPPVDIKAFLESRPSTQQPRAHSPPKLPTQNSAARNIASSSEEAAPAASSLSPAERSRRRSQQRPPAGTARGARDTGTAAVHPQQDSTLRDTARVTLRGALSSREDKLSLREDVLSLREDTRRSAARAGRSRSRSRQECTAVQKRMTVSPTAVPRTGQVPRAGRSRSRPQSTVSPTAVPRTGRSTSRPQSRQPRGAHEPQERRSLGALCYPTINVLVLLQTNECLHMEARYVVVTLGSTPVPLTYSNVRSVLHLHARITLKRSEDVYAACLGTATRTGFMIWQQNSLERSDPCFTRRVWCC